MAKTTSGPRFFKAKKKLASIGSIELSIQDLSDEGAGVAKYNGKTIFIMGALPGEKVIAEIIEAKKRYDKGHLKKIVESSADRVPPFCKHYHHCGGCHLQHLDYRRQVEAKNEQLQQLLSPLVSIKPLATEWLEPIVGKEGHDRYYRQRIRLSISQEKGRLVLGYMSRNSHSVVDINQCPIAAKPLSSLILPLKKVLSSCRQPYLFQSALLSVDEQNSLGLLLQVNKQLSAEDVQILEAFAEQYQVNLSLVVKSKSVDFQSEFIGGSVTQLMSYSLAEFNISLRYDIQDFTQVNTEINALMLARASEWLTLQPDDTLADFFCGIGNISLPFASQVAGVRGYELSNSMVKKASANAKLNRVNNTEYFCKNLFEGEVFYLDGLNKAILDPPRAGANHLCQYLAESKVEKVLYISCNPRTLVRDSEYLLAGGYQITKACLVDMFPHTHHLEAMVLFERC